MTIPPGKEAFWVEMLVRDRMIRNWASLDEAEHLKTISNRILKNPKFAVILLEIYQQILLSSADYTNQTSENSIKSVTNNIWPVDMYRELDKQQLIKNLNQNVVKS